MSKLLKAGAIAGVCVSVSACATVTRGSNTAWEVNTVPSGAKVKTSNGYFCDSTPCSLKMPRRSTFTATITHDGYKPVDVEVTNRVSGAGGAGMAGNVLLGGVIGAGVDVASGAMLDLTPNPATVTMEKIDDTPSQTPPGVGAPGAAQATSPSQTPASSPPPAAEPGAPTAAAPSD